MLGSTPTGTSQCHLSPAILLNATSTLCCCLETQQLVSTCDRTLLDLVAAMAGSGPSVPMVPPASDAEDTIMADATGAATAAASVPVSFADVVARSDTATMSRADLIALLRLTEDRLAVNKLSTSLLYGDNWR